MRIFLKICLAIQAKKAREEMTIMSAKLTGGVLTGTGEHGWLATIS
jgi:hypothetical protein